MRNHMKLFTLPLDLERANHFNRALRSMEGLDGAAATARLGLLQKAWAPQVKG
ncbi:MAG: hypothetical protein A4E45_00076 [Methanosaeta sp. PtaB.Bin039]|nr:MAG: hypothetical protein A4E45_00076 [Methanosaeta sp. PtaB.Bin039]HOT06887.1 hypothetical protein [Methanotrichaceae archaeon]HQF16491.1 hypothetical protein [Methanotrichaceae archaeon]HQJ28471.1 hypothetical protein [Methanotrichaceae archaeon]